MEKQLFKQLPGNARVWIYQSSRELSNTDVQQMLSRIHDFIGQWTSHSRKVIAEGAVLYNRFVVLAADESAFAVSGCSIDSSVSFIRQMEQQFSIKLFDRLAVAYRENGTIKTVDQSAFQQMIEKGVINNETVVFNNLVSTVNDFNRSWEIPLARSWHGKFFKVNA